MILYFKIETAASSTVLELTWENFHEQSYTKRIHKHNFYCPDFLFMMFSP